MANKNYAGTQYIRATRKEQRLIEKIDRRNDKKENLDNTDSRFGKYTFAPGGERVWSF